MYGGRSAFDSALRLTGAKLVVTHTPQQLEAAAGPNAAMIYTTVLGDSLKQAIAIAKKARVPLLLDDAAGIPPIEKPSTLRQDGRDLYCFSGGKRLGRSPMLGPAIRSKRSD